jgi:F0F1-type ATP synthase assembly protein I
VADRKSGAAGFSPGDFAGVGIQFVLAILLFLFVGKWIDARLGTAPVFLIIGTFVGAAGGFYSMYRKVIAATRQDRTGDGVDRR